MRILRFILFPFGIIYWIITSTRNLFYKKGILKSSKFGVPVVNVGNLNMGGTGKTPHVEHLIRLLKDDFKVATLSRGFGRKERGFIIADDSSSALQIGDEPLQYHKKFGDQLVVSVEADRVLGAMDLFRKHPELEVLLLDDAYQHRKIYAGINILLTEYADPFYNDFILPVGNLRESRAGKKRADIIIVTKCPLLSEIQKSELSIKINPNPGQTVFFSHIKYGNVVNFSNEEQNIAGRNVILVTGIANSAPLVKKIGENGTILKHFSFKDHHKFKESELNEIHNLFDKFVNENPIILTTEKDAMRLMTEEFDKLMEKRPWYYQTIEVEIDEKNGFNELILSYVKKDN